MQLIYMAIFNLEIVTEMIIIATLGPVIIADSNNYLVEQIDKSYITG